MRLFSAPNWMILMGLSSCSAALLPNSLDTARVSETPEPVEVAEAAAYGQQPGLRHVEVALDLDYERRIHPTSLREPEYTTRCAPGETVDLDTVSGEAELDALLGCRVRVVSGSDGGWRTVKDGRMDATTRVFEVNHLRVFVPADDWGPSLWLVSPDVVADEAAEAAFRTRGVYEGVLTRLDHLRSNDSGVHRMVAELRERAVGPMADRTWFVLSDRDGRVPSHRFAYLPVQGTDDALFVRVAAADEIDDDYYVTGILERSDPGLARDLGRALGRRLPERVGVLMPGGLQAYAPDSRNPTWFSVLFGSLLIGGGLWWHRRGRDRALEPHEPRAAAPTEPPPGQRFLRRD